MTYHILREELMKTEDEVKGRELNMAWQRISKVSIPRQKDSDLMIVQCYLNFLSISLST